MTRGDNDIAVLVVLVVVVAVSIGAINEPVVEVGRLVGGIRAEDMRRDKRGRGEEGVEVVVG